MTAAWPPPWAEAALSEVLRASGRGTPLGLVASLIHRHGVELAHRRADAAITRVGGLPSTAIDEFVRLAWARGLSEDLARAIAERYQAEAAARVPVDSAETPDAASTEAPR